jgi:hypothetical protein
MRKALIILSLPLLVVLLGFTLVALLPTGNAHAAPATDAPAMQPCTYEDGSGQAVCYWDASEQGNGMGTDVIAGDCSLGTVHTVGASNACITLWPTDNGPVLVGECLTIEAEANGDKAYRQSLINDGWNLEECFKAMIP